MRNEFIVLLPATTLLLIFSAPAGTAQGAAEATAETRERAETWLREPAKSRPPEPAKSRPPGPVEAPPLEPIDMSRIAPLITVVGAERISATELESDLFCWRQRILASWVPRRVCMTRSQLRRGGSIEGVRRCSILKVGEQPSAATRRSRCTRFRPAYHPSTNGGWRIGG